MASAIGPKACSFSQANVPAPSANLAKPGFQNGASHLSNYVQTKAAACQILLQPRCDLRRRARMAWGEKAGRQVAVWPWLHSQLSPNLLGPRWGKRLGDAIPGRRLQVKAEATEAESSGGGEGEGGGSPAAGEETDWRTFRAKLVAQYTPTEAAVAEAGTSDGFKVWEGRKSAGNSALLERQNPLLAREEVWAHPTGGPEEGGLLLAAPGMNVALDERYWQTAVFVVRHSGRGSWGLILNRPSGYTIDQALGSAQEVDALLAPFAGNAIYIGGFKTDSRSMFLLHGHDLPGAEQIVPGVYIGGLEAAAEEVSRGDLPASDFRFFVGRVEWLPGKLPEEVAAQEWYTAACARSLVLKQCLQLPTPLWREILELMGGEYATTARRAYGDLQ